MLEKLVKFGLSDKEAKVYLALLELGASTVTETSRRAGVTRTNTYHLLNSLVSYGLVNLTNNKGKAIFAAEKPEKLLRFLEEKSKEAERKYRDAEAMLPDLKAVFKEGDRDMQVRFFKGQKGPADVYDEMLRGKSEILTFATGETRDSYFENVEEKRVRKGLKRRSIVLSGIGAMTEKVHDVKLQRITKVVPKKYRANLELNIFDNKIAMLSTKGDFAAIIENGELAKSLKQLFELAYESAEKHDAELSPQLEREAKGKDLRGVEYLDM